MSEFRPSWISDFLPAKPAVILDVGTYDCADAIRLKAAYPGARVVAFEASPDAHAAIVAKGDAASAGVEVHHYAVSDKDGTMDFHSNTDARNDNLGCSGSILAPTPHNLAKYPFLKFKEPVKVKATRLDTFCAAHGIEHIDVMHMDVQGAEGYAIEGLGSLRPSLLFFEIDATDEYKGTVPLAELFARLVSWGYEKKWQGAHDALFVLRKPSALDNLTACITSYKRPAFLDRALSSCRAAGIRRVTIATSEPDEAVEAVIARHSQGWLSFDVRRSDEDWGCNSTWLVAAYASRTARVILLHDDDIILPDFGAAYEKTIAPALDAGAGFASWRPNIQFSDGHTEACDYWHGPTRVVSSDELKPIIARCLTHSPVISVLDRQTVIHACKESEQTLLDNESLHRQGMLLGTELVVYIRHIQKFPQWLYVDRVLSSFGHHAESGTIAAFNNGPSATSALRTGYEIAKKQAAGPEPVYAPRLLLMYSEYATHGTEAARIALAEESWKFHFANADVIELPITNSDVSRSGKDIGDKALPFIRDLLDIASLYAMPEDVIVYANRDVGLTTLAPERLLAGVARGNGVTVCPRRMLHPRRYRLYKTVLNCRHDGGFDVMAVTPEWWRKNRDNMPDMLIGREAWDTVFRVLAEEWADSVYPKKTVSTLRREWCSSKAYTDDVCWHQPHDATWDLERTTLPGQKYNRRMARAFFLERGNHALVALIDSYERGAPPRPVVEWPRTESAPRAARTRTPIQAGSSSAPRPASGGTAIVVFADSSHTMLLKYCLKAIDQNASGFSGVTVVVPESDKALFSATSRFPVVGRESPSVLDCDLIVPHAKTVVVLSPDCIMWRKCSPGDLMKDGRPVLTDGRRPVVHVKAVFSIARGIEGPDDLTRLARATLKLPTEYVFADSALSSDFARFGIPARKGVRYIYDPERDFFAECGIRQEAEAWIARRLPKWIIR